MIKKKEITLQDILNEMGSMYSTLWNRIEDIRCELVHFQELIDDYDRTRKALDATKDTLHWYDDNCDSVVARNTLDEIKTTLEQKE